MTRLQEVKNQLAIATRENETLALWITWEANGDAAPLGTPYRNDDCKLTSYTAEVARLDGPSGGIIQIIGRVRGSRQCVSSYVWRVDDYIQRCRDYAGDASHYWNMRRHFLNALELAAYRNKAS